MNEQSMLTLVSVIMLMSLLGNVLQSWWLSKSVPHDLAVKIFERAAEIAKTTPNTEDDKLVQAAKGAYEYLARPVHNPAESRD